MAAPDNKPLRSGDSLPPADWFNGLVRQAQIRRNLLTVPPITHSQRVGGTVLSLNEVKPFYAKLTDVSGLAWSWKEVFPFGTGWLLGPRLGTHNAYEINHSSPIPWGSIVKLYPGANRATHAGGSWTDYRFVWHTLTGQAAPCQCFVRVCVSIASCCISDVSCVTGTVTDLNSGKVVCSLVPVDGVFLCCQFLGTMGDTYTVAIDASGCPCIFKCHPVFWVGYPNGNPTFTLPAKCPADCPIDYTFYAGYAIR
jgi:hypothetical protein